jgi:hypothetical protein
MPASVDLGPKSRFTFLDFAPVPEPATPRRLTLPSRPQRRPCLSLPHSPNSRRLRGWPSALGYGGGLCRRQVHRRRRPWRHGHVQVKHPALQPPVALSHHLRPEAQPRRLATADCYEYLVTLRSGHQRKPGSPRPLHRDPGTVEVQLDGSHGLFFQPASTRIV